MSSARMTRTPEHLGLFPLLSLCLGFFLVVLDTTVLNVALPDIQHQLGGNTATLQWIMNAYTVVLAGLILSGGALGDRHGNKKVYLLGLLVFTLASVLCVFASSGAVLMLARALQGIGAALLLPASLALITSNIPDPVQRNRALGIWGAVAGLAFAGGPLLGGILTSTLGWRSIFLLNIPAGLLALWVTSQRIQETSVRPGTALDLPGQLLIMGALSSLTYGLIETSTLGFDHPLVLAMLGLAAGLLMLFIWREQTTRQPMLPLTLFRSFSFSRGSVAGFLFNFGEYGLLFLLSLFFQNVLHFSALQAGLAFLPLTVVSALMTLPGGRMGAKMGPRLPVLIGFLLMGTGIFLLALAVPAPGVLFWVGMVTFGLGSGLVVPPMTGLTLRQVPRTLSGVGAASLNAARQVGSVMGVAVLGSVLDTLEARGLQLALVLAALACWGGAFAVWPLASGHEEV